MSGVSIPRTSADSANIAMLREASGLFGIAQKRVATGVRVDSAAEDAARYRIASTMRGRARSLDAVNNNVSLALKTLESTDNTVKKMTGLLEAAQTIARRAQAETMPSLYGVMSSTPITAASVIGGTTPGHRLSITSATGMNFTYFVRSTGDTWGDVATALNHANIGVKADFIPSQTAGQTNIRFYSPQGVDFHFDGISDQSIMDDLASVNWNNNATAQQMNGVANAQALFGTAGVVASGETGFTVTYGGLLIGTKNVTAATAVAAGSMLVLEDGKGRIRTFAYAAGTTLGQVITDINTAGLDIRAEFTNQASLGTNEQFRLRNTAGETLHLRHAAGDFASTGSVGIAPASGPLSVTRARQIADFAMRLEFGQQYNAIIAELDLLVQNNPVAPGRNLLAGQNMALSPDEFATGSILFQGIAITAAGTLTLQQSGLTWGNVANIQTSATQINAAFDVLDDFSGRVGAFASYLRERYDLTEDAISAFRSTSAEIVGADMAEESAAMSAMQTRQQFAVQAYAMASQSDSGLLRLLS